MGSFSNQELTAGVEVEVEFDTRVAGKIATNKVEVLARSGGSTAGDGDLCARRVELSTAGGVLLVGNLRLVEAYMYFFRIVSHNFSTS